MQNILQKYHEIINIHQLMDANVTNGINLLNSTSNFILNKIHTNDLFFMKNKISSNDLDFQKNYIIKTLSFDFIKAIDDLIKEGGFKTQWENLNIDDQLSILLISNEVYFKVREVLNPEDLNSIFLQLNINNYQSFMPSILQDWINTNSKVQLFKIKKSALNTPYEQFFEQENIGKMENSHSKEKIKFALTYLAKNASDLTPWNKNVDYLFNDEFVFSLTFKHFLALEQIYTKFDVVKENIVLPEILKIWCSKIIDQEMLDKENLLFSQALENKNESERNELYSHIFPCSISPKISEYPNIKLFHELVKKPISPDVFNDLTTQSIGTPYEDFFKNPKTKEVSLKDLKSREEYMFMSLCDIFIENISKVETKRLKI